MSRPLAPAAVHGGGAAALPLGLREPLRDLVLALADSKRLLGLHYSDRMLGAPSLEAGIAAASMAQDEWGHARLTYALLADFGDEPQALEHERAPEEYCAIEALDRGFASWSEMIAAALVVDSALTVQYAALRESAYTPLRNRVQKLLDEESFHFQYAAGWARLLAAAPAARPGLLEALQRLLPIALCWFGRPDDPTATRLVAAGLTGATPDELRARLLERLAPLLEEAGLAAPLGVPEPGAGSFAALLDWRGWSDTARRHAGGSPGAEIIARARGDRNRALLLD